MSSDALHRSRALRKEGRVDAAVEVLVDAVRRDALSPTDLASVGRRLQSWVEAGDVAAPPLRVAVLGQCTTTWLMQVLTAICWGRRQPAVVTEADYDQVMQTLLGMQPGDVDVVVLVPWCKRLLSPGRSDAEAVADELDLWRATWSRIAALDARVVMVGYDTPHVGSAGAHLSPNTGPVARIRHMNAALREHLPQGAYLVDLERVAGELGRRAFYDDRRWFWTKQPFSEAGVVLLARHVHAGVRAVTTGPRKVLVLDLDNTLWGGVVGELGPLGVALGDSPDGEAFRAFQAWCKGLTDRGVLLAVASKNNPDDAREPFVKHPDMVLQLDDFAAFEAHWSPKSQSLADMAATLRLGLDSFVFVDDNPAEREQVRQALPDVEVVDIPEDPAGYVAAVEAGLWFEAVAVTVDDRQRAAQYLQEAQRRETQRAFGSIEDWLGSMQMVGDVRRVDDEDLQRVVQLLGKTNQFNLTTRRHPRTVVERWVADARAVPLTLRLADRFGDHGLVGLVLGVPHDEHALRLDTWLMSCRVIGRTAEHFVLHAVVEQARALGFRRLVAEYVPSRKNAQVADLFPGFGFRPAPAPDTGEEGLQWFEADLHTLELPTTFVRPAR